MICRSSKHLLEMSSDGRVDPLPADDRGLKRDRDERSPPRRDRRDGSRDRRDRRDRDRSRSRDRGDGRRGGRRRDRRDRRSSRSRSRSPRRDRRETSAERAEREAMRERRREEREMERKRRELETLERDARTVFAYNLSTKADERDIFQFFSAVGTVNDVRIIYDRNTPTSKGMAYVEFAEESSVEPALACTGQILRNQVVMVKASEAEKNAAWKIEKAQKKKAEEEAKAKGADGGVVAGDGGTQPMGHTNTTNADTGAAAGAATGVAPHTDPTRTHIPLPPPLAGGAPLPPPPPRSCELNVDNVHCDVGEEDLRAVFEPFGPLERVSVAPRRSADVESVSATVRYGNAQHAVLALAQLNGLELVGRAMEVSMAAPDVRDAADARSGPDLMSDSALGVKMDSRSRAALMAKLAGQDPATAAPLGIDPKTGLPASADQMAAARVAAAEAAAGVQRGGAEAQQGVLGPASPIPTECVLLKNMFRAEEETEDEWWLDIAEDVQEECAQFGEVKHAFVDRESEGFVYLKFSDVAGAKKAKDALHGRWFAGRTVAAEFQFTAVYDRHFDV